MTIRSVLSWLGGSVLTLLGLLLLIGAPPVGLVVLLIGLYAIPPIRRKIDVRISLGELLSWLASAVLILLGLLLAMEIPVGAVIAFSGGLFALPPLRKRLTTELDVSLPRGAVAVVVVLAAGAAFGMLSMDVQPDRTTATHDLGETFVVEGESSRAAVTIEEARQTRSLWLQPRDERHPPERDAYLAVTMQIDNTGNESVRLDRSDLAVVNATGAEVYDPSPNSARLRPPGRYQVPGVEFGEQGTEIGAGETLRATVLFDVEADRTYFFTVPTTEPFYEADHHYVPLGRIE